MGDRGPSPQPTALRMIRGNPGKRGMSPREPKLAPVTPECPRWVSASAREHWPEIAGMLGDMGVCTKADKVALGLLVDVLARYLAARKVVDEEGPTFTTEKGYVCVRPEVSIMQCAWEQALKALKEFGLTPSARTKVQVLGEGQKDEFEDFMERRA